MTARQAAELRLSPDLALPIEAATRRMAILAMSGAGKSNLAVVLAEEMFAAGIPWVAIDPKGDWYGIRSSESGKRAGLPVCVFGGLHGDVPLEPTAGKLLGELIATHRLTCVLDVSEFERREEQFRFLADLAETLLKKNTQALHLFLEEADEYLPQSPREKGALPRCLGAWARLVKRGRFRGIGCTLITQRSASLNKDVLNMAECLFAMRVTAPTDRKAILGWVETHGLGKEIVNDLPTLQDGEAWVWSPAWLRKAQKTRFRRRKTFDSGRTPDIGQSIEPATLANIDLGKIEKDIAATLERAKADDPAELRKQIAQLKKDLAQQTQAAEPVQVRDEAAIAEAVQEATGPLIRTIDAHETVFQEIGEIAQRLADLCKDRVEINALARKAESRKPQPPPPPAARPQPEKPEPAAEPGEIPQGCAKPLAALAAVFPSGMTEAQWAIAAGYKRSGGTWGTYKSRLRSAGLIDRYGNRWFATESGANAVGDVEQPPPPGPDLVRWWAGRLPGTSKIAEALIQAWPNGLTKEELAERVGMAVSGGSFGTYLSRLAGPELITREHGQIRLSTEAMGEAE
jgi:uncharacterized protein